MKALLTFLLAAGLATGVALAQESGTNKTDDGLVLPEGAPKALPENPDSDAAEESESVKPKAAVEKLDVLPDDLDELFVLLKRERDSKKAERISTRIWEKWHESGSKSVDLLARWARDASSRKKYGVALDLLDQIIVLRPQYAEAWNQRATLHYVMSNYSKSLADIERTLALEPRHYGALSGMAAILQTLGRKEEALEIWYRALSIYPAMPSAQKAVIALEEELAGRGI